MAKKTLTAKVEELTEKVNVLQHFVEGYMKDSRRKPAKDKRSFDAGFDDELDALLDFDYEPAKTKKRGKAKKRHRIHTIGTDIGVYEVCVTDVNVPIPDGVDPEMPSSGDEWFIPARCELVAIVDAIDDEDGVRYTDFPEGRYWTLTSEGGYRWTVDIASKTTQLTRNEGFANVIWVRRV